LKLIPFLLLLGCGGGGDDGGGGDADSDSDSDADTDGDTDTDAGDCAHEPPPLGDALVQTARMANERPDGSENKVEVTDLTTVGDRGFACSNKLGAFAVDLRGDDVVRTEATSKLVCQHVVADSLRMYVTNHGTTMDPAPSLRAFGADDLLGEDEVAEAGVLYEGMDLEGDILVVAEHERGIEVFDAPSLASLSVTGGFGNAFAVDVVGDLAYVADGASGVKVVDLSDPAAPSIVGEAPTSSAATAIAVDGSAVAVAVSSAGTDVFRLVDGALELVANVPTPNTTTDVAISASVLYTAEWSEVRVFDLGALDCQPVLLASEAANVTNAFSRLFGVEPYGNGLLVGGWETVVRYQLDTSVGGPEAALSQDVVSFGTIEEESAVQTILLRNDGDRDLEISGASASGDFSVDFVPEVVAAGEQGFFELTFTPSGAATVNGTVTLSTNDPDEASLELTVVGNAPGYGVGDTLPADTEFVDADSGETFALADLQGSYVLLAYFATF